MKPDTFNCGFLKFRNSCFGESKVFHTKGQRMFSHVAAGAGDAGSIPSGNQAANGELRCRGTLVPCRRTRKAEAAESMLQRRGSIFIDG